MNARQMRQMAARLEKEADRLTAAADRMEGTGKPGPSMKVTKQKAAKTHGHFGQLKRQIAKATGAEKKRLQAKLRRLQGAAGGKSVKLKAG